MKITRNLLLKRNENNAEFVTEKEMKITRNLYQKEMKITRHLEQKKK